MSHLKVSSKPELEVWMEETSRPEGSRLRHRAIVVREPISPECEYRHHLSSREDSKSHGYAYRLQVLMVLAETYDRPSHEILRLLAQGEHFVLPLMTNLPFLDNKRSLRYTKKLNDS